MRLFTFLPLLLSPLALASPTLDIFDDQSPFYSHRGSLTVPGENPLAFCHDPKDDILSIERVDLFPNPPIPGEKLIIKATGTFAKEVEQGAKVFLEVKYGLIRLIKQEADLCEQIENVDMHCPLEKGKMALTKEVDIPKEVPPGKYTVLADVYTKDGETVTCLEASVVFNIRR
ncbi:hypothetical protein VTO42DRAFT_1322 [Malbranchea cinnamomea]